MSLSTCKSRAMALHTKSTFTSAVSPTRVPSAGWGRMTPPISTKCDLTRAKSFSVTPVPPHAAIATSSGSRWSRTSMFPEFVGTCAVTHTAKSSAGASVAVPVTVSAESPFSPSAPFLESSTSTSRFASSHLCAACHVRAGLIAWSCATKSKALASASSARVAAAFAFVSAAATLFSAAATRAATSVSRFCVSERAFWSRASSLSLFFFWPSFTPTATPSALALTVASRTSLACVA
mmetsp:Transcript_4465/g.16531  ORF Transcript_4465/g.16531 Transcript_4465/m.16531 type:complete len:236 (-) Transcript_4465:1055-1762(-)